LNGRRFDPWQYTVGDLVNVNRKVGASQEFSNPIQVSGCNGECRRLHSELGLPCTGILCGFSGGPAAIVNANGAGHFDPRLPTIGDLVGKTVEAAANSPPVTRRINGKLDLSKPTVGDLTGPKSVRGHTSGRTVSTEPDDFLLHPRKIRMCSR
jgi:hypothetical protein